MWVPRAMYSLRMSFWRVPLSCDRSTPCFLPTAMVEGQEDGRRGVDGHRGADLVEGNALEEHLHVGKAGYGDTGAPDLARSEGVVGVVAGLRREVEGDAEAGLSVFEEVAVAGIGLLRRGEAGVLAHSPHSPAVHVGLNAAGVGVLAGVSEGVRVVEVTEIFGGVDGIDLDAGVGLEAVASLAESFFNGLEGAFVPFLFVVGWHGSLCVVRYSLESQHSFDFTEHPHPSPLPRRERG